MSIDFGNDIYEEPIVAKTFLAEDAQESSLRPKTLAEYIGQEKAKENLSIFIQAARKRQESLDHVLLHGPPGLGKTTLAGIIAQEMGVNIRITSGPAIEKPGDLAALLTNLNEGDILFVDEIHRLNRSVEEILYPAMEDYALDIIVGKGPSANSIRLDLPHFTLIGATTRAGQLSAPLRDRFGVTLRLELYTPEELSKIVTRSAGILNCDIVPEGAYEIARRSRGTPRIANRMLRRVRDFADVKAGGAVAALAFAFDMPLVLIPVGIIYILETLSDIIQVGYFKATHGKRFFKMAPLHHHLERCGWSEVKIVTVFVSITAVFCLLAYYGIRGRYL